MSELRPLAVVTGASSGIGYELARLAAEDGYDLIIAADEPSIVEAQQGLRQFGGAVDAVQVDLSTTEGVDRLLEGISGRPVDLLMANAGRGLGHGFLDQAWDDARLSSIPMSPGRSISSIGWAATCEPATAAGS